MGKIPSVIVATQRGQPIERRNREPKCQLSDERDPKPKSRGSLQRGVGNRT
jgi:hypothetical protein